MTDLPYREVCEDAAPELAPGQSYEIPNPLRGHTWTDELSVTWRRRGQGTLTPKQARKLLARTDVLVMHVYDGAAHEHSGPDRAGLLAEVEQFWDGVDANPMRTFDLGEFRDDVQRAMVMIVEGC